MTPPAQSRKLKTTKEIAELIQQSEGAIRIWKQKGCPHVFRGGRLYFDPEKVAEWRQEHGLNGMPGARKGNRHWAVKKAQMMGLEPGDQTARDRWEAARAAKLEIEVDRLRGLLVPVADVEAELVAAVRLFRSEILALPQRLAPVFAGMDSVPKIEQRMREELEEVLTSLAEADSWKP